MSKFDDYVERQVLGVAVGDSVPDPDRPGEHIAEVELATIPNPTEEGKRRYEPDGLYEGDPCTCKPECPSDCKGGCGCKACRNAYGDFLSSE